MMRMAAKASACLLFLCPQMVFGEELAGLTRNPGLNLESVITKAFERSPRQNILQAERMVAKAREISATGLLPTSPAVSLGHQNDTVGSHRNLSQWEAAVEVPVWMPGQRTARTTLARMSQGELSGMRNGLLLEVAGQVREAIWDIAMANNLAELAQTRLTTAQALQRDVEKRRAAGELAKTDVMLAQNEVLQAQTELLHTQAEVQHAEHRYWVLTGLKEIPATAEETLTTINNVTETHPLLAESSSRLALARSQRDLTQVERRENPQITLNLRHERGAFDNQFNDSVGLSIRLPLDTQVRTAPMLAESEMGIARASTEHEQRLIELQTAQHEAEHNLEVIRAELVIVEEQQRLSQENLRLARKAFALGESDLISLLRVQAMAQEVERSLLNRHIQLKWNIARYNQALGVIP